MVSPGAATDGVTLFFPPKSDDLFSVIVLLKVMTFFQLATPLHVACPVFLVNTAPENLISFGYHPLDGVTQSGPPSPSPSNATGKRATQYWQQHIHIHIAWQ